MSSTIYRAVWGASKSKYLVSVAAAVMLAACSNSADRLSQNPSDSDPVYTASVPRDEPQASSGVAPVEEGITSRPLANASVKTPSHDYGTPPKRAVYKQPEIRQPAVAQAEEAPASGRVTVGSGMTLYSIARANNLTVSQLASANGIKPPYAVHTGQVLRIPGASDPAVPAPRTAQMAAKPAPVSAPPASHAAAGSHTVKSGETLYSLGRKYGVSPFAIADANRLPHGTQLSLGQSLKIPGGGKPAPVLARAEPAPAPKLQEQASAPGNNAPDTEESAAAPAETSAKIAEAPAVAPAPSAEPAQAEAQAETAPAEAGSTGLRWPVRGKVISGFGPKTNGLKNEGINIAVPEGTSVRAAEGGVVAYAGNELKGYGNLVLIRHEDGFVTAYAHAKELFVKRGDTVKRGDVIAKAGQTGSVSSPQLHFEVRKGATALDPMKYLSASTAAN